MTLPPATFIRQDDTHRLIPSRYSKEGGSVLDRIADTEDERRALFELDSATNERLLGETGRLPGISVHELVFGVAYAHIVNASFTHPHPLGSRFSGPDRGVWYAGFALETAQREVAYHKAEELHEIDWGMPETVSYAEYLADFRTEFSELRNRSKYAEFLDPDSYIASQALGRELLNSGSPGVVYPSVRHRAGTCVGCFRPVLVANVRQGDEFALTLHPGGRRPEWARL